MRRRFWLSRRSAEATSVGADVGDVLSHLQRHLICRDVYLASRGFASTDSKGWRQHIGFVGGVEASDGDMGHWVVNVETTEEYEARQYEIVGGVATGRQDADAVEEEHRQREYEAVRQHRIVDTVSSVAYTEIQRNLNDNLLVEPATGTLIASERRRIENAIETSLQRVLTAPTQVRAIVDRGTNFASTRTIAAQLRLTNPDADLRIEARQPDAAGATVQPGQLVYATSDGAVTTAPSRHLPVAGTLVSYDGEGGRCVAFDGGGSITMQMDAMATASDVAATAQRAGIDAVASRQQQIGAFDVDEAEVRGTSSLPMGRTTGTYSASGSITVSPEAFQRWAMPTRSFGVLDIVRQAQVAIERHFDVRPPSITIETYTSPADPGLVVVNVREDRFVDVVARVLAPLKPVTARVEVVGVTYRIDCDSLSQLRSHRADLLVVDDLIDEAEPTPERREQIRQVYDELSSSRLHGDVRVAAPATATVRLTNTSSEAYTVAPGVLAVSSAAGAEAVWVNSDIVTLPPGDVEVSVHCLQQPDGAEASALAHIVRTVLPGVVVSQHTGEGTRRAESVRVYWDAQAATQRLRQHMAQYSTFETAAGSDLDEIALTIYGLSRANAESDVALRQRCLDGWHTYCAREDATAPTPTPRTYIVDAVEVAPTLASSPWMARLLPWLGSEIASNDAELRQFARDCAVDSKGVTLVYVEERRALRVEREEVQLGDGVVAISP